MSSSIFHLSSFLTLSSIFGAFLILKSPFFIIEKAGAPKYVVKFCQKSIGAVRSNLSTSIKLTGTGRKIDRWTGKQTEMTTYWVRLTLWLNIGDIGDFYCPAPPPPSCSSWPSSPGPTSSIYTPTRKDKMYSQSPNNKQRSSEN